MAFGSVLSIGCAFVLAPKQFMTKASIQQHGHVTTLHGVSNDDDADDDEIDISMVS